MLETIDNQKNKTHSRYFSKEIFRRVIKFLNRNNREIPTVSPLALRFIDERATNKYFLKNMPSYR